MVIAKFFEGYVYGDIIWPMRGNKGFGYDPIFQATGHDITFAQMDPQEKTRHIAPRQCF